MLRLRRFWPISAQCSALDCTVLHESTPLTAGGWRRFFSSGKTDGVKPEEGYILNVSNIPWGCSWTAIEHIFEQFGPVVRVQTPPRKDKSQLSPAEESSRHCTARVEMATRIGADAAILALNRRKAFSETCGPIGVRYTGYTANNIAENILRAKGTPLFSSDTSTIRVLGVPGSEARRLAKAIQTWNPYVSIEEVERLSYGAWIVTLGSPEEAQKVVKSLKAQKKQWPAATSIWALERDYRSVRAFPISEAAAEEYKVALRDVDPEFRSVQVKYRLPEGAAPDEDRIKAAAERHGAVVALSTFQEESARPTRETWTKAVVTFDSSMAAGAMLAECFAPETADAIGALEVAAAHRLTRMTRRQITRLPPPSVPYSASRIVVVKGAPSDPDHALETAKRVFEPLGKWYSITSHVRKMGDVAVVAWGSEDAVSAALKLSGQDVFGVGSPARISRSVVIGVYDSNQGKQGDIVRNRVAAEDSSRQ